MQRDIKYTSDGDIDISNGDISYTESTAQHQYDLLMSSPGDYKERPVVGVDAIKSVNDNDSLFFLRTVRKQMQSDGMTVRRVAFIDGELIIDADYENSKNNE